MSEFDDFFAAIAGQESGGNYSAVNARTGASGKYQIMPANIGPWSRQYLGYSVSVDQFRSSPQIQEQLARAVLQGYYQKYGLRGAAAAWYSGNPNSAGNYKRFLSNEPSVGEYVDQVIGRMGQSPSRVQQETAGAQAIAASAQVTQPSSTATGPLGLTGVDSSGAGIGAADGNTVTSGLGLGRADGTASISSSQSNASTAGASGLRQAVIEKAMSLLGTPYVWGGASQSGTDCSGLTLQAYGSVGVSMGHYHANQLSMGKKTDVSSLKPGDLVGWNGASHVALYIGNGQIIEAPRPGESVRVRNIGGSWDQQEGIYGVDMSNYLG